MEKMVRLASQLQPDSIVDGVGIRTVIWMQGCSHNCLGCHNPETHNFKGGFLKNIDELKSELSTLNNQDGITLTGGDPLFQVEASLEIAKYSKSIGLDVWCYTGFKFEELISMKNTKVLELLKYIDILVDGKFKLEEKSLDIPFRGSKNQRILDVKKSIKLNRPVEIQKYKIKKQFECKDELVFV